MRTTLALVLVVSLAGCAAKPVGYVPDVYLEDAAGDAQPRYDIVRANFTELNGSLVLRVEIQNYKDGLPLIDARIDTSRGDFFARLVLDPSRPQPPKARAEQGRWLGDERVETAATCWFPSLPTSPDSTEPWWIFLELLNNRTGFDRDGGGTIRSLSVVTMDEYGTVQDEARHERDARVRGGANPYGEDCPMSRERARLT